MLFQLFLFMLVGLLCLAQSRLIISLEEEGYFDGCNKNSTCFGKLTTKWHDIAGNVYLEDDNIMCIENFVWDGLGANADISIGNL